MSLPPVASDGSGNGGDATLAAGNGENASNGDPGTGGSVFIVAGYAGEMAEEGTVSKPGGSVFIDAGVPSTGGEAKGGDIQLHAGSPNGGASTGGNIILQAGGFGANAGHIFMLTLPTADPHVAGAVWSNSGVLTLSAG